MFLARGETIWVFWIHFLSFLNGQISLEMIKFITYKTGVVSKQDATRGLDQNLEQKSSPSSGWHHLTQFSYFM